jgi:Type III restriction enzyme, res subunit
MNDDLESWLTDRQWEAVHQVERAINLHGAAIVWWKIGEGKTRIALQSIINLFGSEPDDPKHILIICSPQAFRQWQDEFDTMSNQPNKEKLLFHYFSYGLLSTKYAATEVLNIFDNIDPDLVIVDELWLFKNPRTIRSITLHEITERFPTIGLSGSMVTARNIEDLYGQAKAVDAARLLGTSLTHFRTQFCVPVEEFGLKFYAKKGALTTIQQRLAPVVDIYFPPNVRETRIQPINVEPTNEQLTHIKNLIDEFYTQFDTVSNTDETKAELEIKLTTSLMVKLQQVSDGVVLLGGGETIPLSSNKELRLYQLLDEYTDAGEQIVVWFAFKASLNKVYQKLGKKATCLSSDHKFDAEGWKQRRYNICLATIGSGASLNDFANCQHTVIYSCANAPVKLQQAMGRTNRKSSQQPVCHYQFLSTLQTPDQAIYQNCRISTEVEKSIIRSSTEIIREYLSYAAPKPK